ncbi:3' exoribonuclease [Candidatus Koribacter versatilis Ellin345]|uniref:Polyribonucleotide nucleotidyltransferase n=1 Tax=Koribacter versatilis (strain Ellin345) TaxID=204669 RepID=PNP_KORVE|nr:polyribonucleotide nucleotidyltransferase [Candidatus Koribacter versatilis]Q1IQ54.1 RecName: Full=Polyribonucleotide nucleotidyltransferase; AltName: Full=Polynucleotide phosphorylase; Short=PNPase [Candidatus Koribacter versatilis Ellin345]ABF40996.1 3' exoribonuclease [Candidatus Koribacter versatilis Ellin345]
MKPEPKVATVEFTGGKSLSFETGKLAKQAHGSAIVRSGQSVVLATACANADPREGIDFFPLTVDYREYTYAGGRFPGGFIKREGRPSEKEILTSRQIDRPIRPLFPEGFRCETQVIAMVLSADSENDPDVCGINGASAALAVSDIPFNGPIGAVRVGLIEGQNIVNPTYDEMRASKLNIMVVGTAEGIVMIESGAHEATEEEVVSAIEFGHGEIKKICAVISKLAKEVGKTKRTVAPVELDQPYLDGLRKKIGADLADALNTEKYPKSESYAKVKEIKSKLKEEIPADDDAALKKLGKYYELLREDIFRQQVTKEKRRPDGRAFDQIRQIWIEVDVLPRTHGSAVFTRGETQALVTTTLGTGDDMQRMEGFEGEAKKRFMLHYNFPPFSVGEVAFLRGAGRREIGHGALAERALSAVLPSEDKWPYAMRVVSDILESNGSSSMASICGGSLSLMDAGVPLKAPVAGIAMGLVKEGDDYAILTDIAGAEDHYGDMDFKVAGTTQGITALQMDIKIGGITAQIMREALEQARRGRLFILDKMNEVIQSPRTELSEFAPRFYTLQIPTDKIRDLIGPGGKVIRGIVEATGVKIDVEDSGKVNVASSDQEAAKKALKMIGDITATAEVGKTYLGTVTRLADFGAFVEILPGTDGLLHISEVAEHRIKDVKDELHEGDQVLVKVLAVDGNRIKLSRKAVLKEQRAKMATEGGGDGGPAPEVEHSEHGAPGGVTFEGGYEGGDEPEVEEGEPNFNRDDAPGSHGATQPHSGGDRPDRGPRPHGGGGGAGRGGRGRRPGGGGGGGRGGHGGRGGGGGGRGRG